MVIFRSITLIITLSAATAEKKKCGPLNNRSGITKKLRGIFGPSLFVVGLAVESIKPEVRLMQYNKQVKNAAQKARVLPMTLCALMKLTIPAIWTSPGTVDTL